MPDALCPLLCISGTGTDVGKSVVTAALLRALRQKGLDAQALKPVQTGCAASPEGQPLSPDAALYKEACPQARALSLISLAPPCSPHLAAETENRPIASGPLLEKIRAAAQTAPFTLLEGAGGLLTPLSTNECFIDLFAALEAPLVLVGANVLGTVNHVLLSLEALRARKVNILRVVLAATMPPGEPGSLSERIERDNPLIIAELGKVETPLCLPYARGLRNPDPDERDAAWAHLAACLAPLADQALAGRPPLAGSNDASLTPRDV